MRSARRAARPWRYTCGAPAGLGRISISRQPTPLTPRPSTLLMASFAAQRPASRSTLPPTYRRSRSVRTRSRNRSGNFPSTRTMRSMSMRSIPTSWRLMVGIVPEALFDRHRFREVARLVHVGAAGDGDLVGQELEREDGDHRADLLGCLRDVDDVVRIVVDLVVALGGDRNDRR